MTTFKPGDRVKIIEHQGAAREGEVVTVYQFGHFEDDDGGSIRYYRDGEVHDGIPWFASYDSVELLASESLTAEQRIEHAVADLRILGGLYDITPQTAKALEEIIDTLTGTND